MNYAQNNNLSMMKNTMLLLTSFNHVWRNNVIITAVVNEFKTHLITLLATNRQQETKIIDTAQMKHPAQENRSSDTFSFPKAEMAYGVFIENPVIFDDTVKNMRAVSTDIDLHICAVKALLNEQLDPLIEVYKTSHVPFYNQYISARSVSVFGCHKTGSLKGFIYNNHKVALSGANISITGITSCKDFTNTEGGYNVEQLPPGIYTISVSLVNYSRQSKIIQVKENHSTEINFVMLSLNDQ